MREDRQYPLNILHCYPSIRRKYNPSTYRHCCSEVQLVPGPLIQNVTDLPLAWAIKSDACIALHASGDTPFAAARMLQRRAHITVPIFSTNTSPPASIETPRTSPVHIESAIEADDVVRKTMDIATERIFLVFIAVQEDAYYWGSCKVSLSLNLQRSVLICLWTHVPDVVRARSVPARWHRSAGAGTGIVESCNAILLFYHLKKARPHRTGSWGHIAHLSV